MRIFFIYCVFASSCMQRIDLVILLRESKPVTCDKYFPIISSVILYENMQCPLISALFHNPLDPQ